MNENAQSILTMNRIATVAKNLTNGNMSLGKLSKIQPRITQIFGNVLVYNGVNIYAQS